MLSLAYRSQKSLLQYLAHQSLALSADISDSSLSIYEENLRQCVLRLAQDRRILLFGQKASGKSSLLASLIEEPIVAAPAFPKNLLRWRMNPQLEADYSARYLMRDDLSDIEFIDTGDFSDTQLIKTLPQLIDTCDVALAVLDCRRIHESSFWTFLDEMQQSAARCSLILVVTHTDSIGTLRKSQLKDALRNCVRKYLSHAMHCFTLDGANDRTTIEKLRFYIQDILDGDKGLRADLEQAANTCQDLLQKQAIVLSARRSSRRADTGFLLTVDDEINRFEERQQAGVDALVESYMQEITTLSEKLCDGVNANFSSIFIPTDLFLLGRLAPRIELRYYKSLREQILKRQAESDDQFILACESHWISVEERMREKLHCDIGDFQTEHLRPQLSELHRHLLHVLHELVQKKKYRHEMRRIFTPVIAKIYPIFVLICLSMAVAGIFGYHEYDLFAIVCFIIAIILWMLTSLVQHLSIKALSKSLRDLTAAMNTSMLTPLHNALTKLVRSRVAAYRQLYKEPRQLLVEQEEMLVPLTERQRIIYQQFSAFRRTF